MLRDIAGNAPAWFDGNAHAAVFTGFKSQALAQSQSGTGGYQHCVWTTPPGKAARRPRPRSTPAPGTDPQALD